MSDEDGVRLNGVPPRPVVSHSTTKSRTLQAWAGSCDDIERLEDAVRRHLDIAFQRDLKSSGSASDGGGYLRESFARRYVATTEVVDGKSRERWQGRISEFANELHPPAIKTVSVGNIPAHPDSPKIAVQLGGVITGVGREAILVEGPDRDWVNSAYAELDKLASRGRPWWAWLAADWGAALLVFLYALLLQFIARAGYPGSLWDQPLWEFNPLADVGVSIACTGIAAILTWATRKLFFPRFELLQPGTADRLSRRWVGALSVVAALLGFASSPLWLW